MWGQLTPPPPPPGLPLFPPAQGSACASLYKHLSWGHTGVCALAAQPLASLQEVQCIERGAGLFPLRQFHHHKAEGIMKVGV